MSCHKHGFTLGDTLLSTLVFSPLVVAYWRGTWQLLELYLFPDNQELGNWISLGIGLTIIVLFGVIQRPLGDAISSKRSRIWFIVGSRIYTLLYAFANVNHWRGVWEIFTFYTGKGWTSALLSAISGAVVLITLKGLRNIVAPPCVIIIDEENDYFTVPTMFKTHESPRELAFILDVLFSVLIVGSLVVFVWRGLWLLLDIYFFADQQIWSAWGSCVLGIVIALISALIQTPSSRISRKLAPWARIAYEDLLVLIVNFGTINVWRGMWKLMDIYLCPDDPLLSNLISQVVGFTLLALSYNSNSILSRGVVRDGDDDSDQFFQIEYLQKFKKVKRDIKEKQKKLKAKEHEMVQMNSTDVKYKGDETVADVVITPLMEDPELHLDGTLPSKKLKESTV